jgi:hypothetical protein
MRHILPQWFHGMISNTQIWPQLGATCSAGHGQAAVMNLHFGLTPNPAKGGSSP